MTSSQKIAHFKNREFWVSDNKKRSFGTIKKSKFTEQQIVFAIKQSESGNTGR